MTENKPYTYVTVSLSSEKSPAVGVTFCTSDVRVQAMALSSGRPCFDLHSNEANVSVSTTGAGPVTSADLALARQIFTAAARYLADCEYLHAEQRDGTGTDAVNASGEVAA